MMLEVINFICKERSPPILPHLFRDGSEFKQYREFPFLVALKELTPLSLITSNDVNDSQSMYPVVHTWARERLEFSATG